MLHQKPPPEPWSAGSVPPAYQAYPLTSAPGGWIGWGPGDRALFGRRRRPGLVVGLCLLGCAVLGGAVLGALFTQDEDPAPDAAPVESRPPAVEAAVQDGFYRTDPHQPTGCREPNPDLSTQTSVTAYYAGLMQCLDRAWAAPVRAGGDTFRAPRMLTWSRSADTPCSSGRLSTSFYCPANESLYLKFDDDVRRWNSRRDPDNRAFARMWASQTVAHHYAHHLQELAGILPATATMRYAATTQEQRLEISRRTELQASCLGGAFLGANQMSYGITGLNRRIYDDFVQRAGDEDNPARIRDHGSRASHKLWTGQGFSAPSTWSCNTFAASATKVS